MKYTILIITLIFFSSNVFALDSQQFRPLTKDMGMFSVYTSHGLQKEKWNYGLIYNYAKNPIEFGADNFDRIDDVVNNLHTVNLGLAYKINKNFSLMADIPLYYVSEYEELVSDIFDSGFGLGDIQLSLNWNLRQKKYEAKNQWGFSVVPYLSVPTGSEDLFLSVGKVRFGITGVADKYIKEKHLIAFNLGLFFAPKQRIITLEYGSGLNLSAGYTYDFGEKNGYSFTTELFGRQAMGNVDATEINSPLEWLVGLSKYDKKLDKKFNIGAGMGLNNGYGAPDYRLFAGLSMHWDKARKSRPEKVEVTEKVVEEEQKVNLEKAVALEKPVLLKIEKIYFKTASSRIKKVSLPVLNKLADLLTNHPEIKKMSIEGHTDNVGLPDKNLTLSKARAWRVYDYLHKKGISYDRLQFKGLGEELPIDSNETDQGRSNNRRVDFNILEMAEGAKIDIEKLNTEAELN